MAAGRQFLVHASTLLSGTVLAQAITFGLSFVLTRLYVPSEFGRYAIFTGTAAVLGAMSTGALDRVILLDHSLRQARRAATAVLAIAFTAACIASVCGILLVATGLASAIPLTATDLILYIPLFMLGYAGAQVFTYSRLRERRSRDLATFKVGQSIVMALLQTSLASVKAVPGLVLGNLAGWMLLAGGGIGWRYRLGHFRRDLRRRSLRATLRRHWRFPRYVMPNEVLDGLSNQVPIFLIGTLISLSVAGHYGLAIMILSAPAAVIGQAVGQAFMQVMGRHGELTDGLRPMVYRIWMAMAALGIVPFAVIFAFGPEIFTFAFGANWREAGVVAQLLAPLLFVRLVSSPTSTLYLRLHLQREQWWFCLAAALYRSAAYGSALLGADLRTMITIHVVVEIVAIILYNLVALRHLRPAPAA